MQDGSKIDEDDLAKVRNARLLDQLQLRYERDGGGGGMLEEEEGVERERIKNFEESKLSVRSVGERDEIWRMNWQRKWRN